MSYKTELLKLKEDIDYVTFKLQFYKGYYALKMINKKGYVEYTSQGECLIDIHEDEAKDCLNWLKSNGFKISKYSVLQ